MSAVRQGFVLRVSGEQHYVGELTKTSRSSVFDDFFPTKVLEDAFFFLNAQAALDFAQAFVADGTSPTRFTLKAVYEETTSELATPERIEFAKVFSHAPEGAKREYVIRCQPDEFGDYVMRRGATPGEAFENAEDIAYAERFPLFMDAQRRLNKFLTSAGDYGGLYENWCVYPVNVWPAVPGKTTTKRVLV